MYVKEQILFTLRWIFSLTARSLTKVAHDYLESFSIHHLVKSGSDKNSMGEYLNIEC